MLLKFLKDNYEVGEPIFTADIQIERLTEVNKRQQVKKLVEAGEIKKFESGIYYLPKATRLVGGVELSSDLVAKYKYVARRETQLGYYSGHTFANLIGVSTQVPYKKEIVSNNMAAIVREVMIGSKPYVVRKPAVQVTSDNYKTLQLLDLLKDLGELADEAPEIVKEQIELYISRNTISRDEVEKYIDKFPMKTYKNIFEMRLDHVFA